MLADSPVRSAEIINLSDRLNRFSTADRLALMEWQALGETFRLTIHKRLPDDPPEIGEFASIYRGSGHWASWGVARHGRTLRVWRATDGHDLGRFESMREALAAVTLPIAVRQRR